MPFPYPPVKTYRSSSYCKKLFDTTPPTSDGKLYLRCFWNGKINEGRHRVKHIKFDDSIRKLYALYRPPSCTHAHADFTWSVHTQFFEFNILLEIYNMMKLTFIAGLATCFNCVPHDVRMINKILFFWKFFSNDMVCSVEFLFSKGKGNNLTGTTELN